VNCSSSARDGRRAGATTGAPSRALPLATTDAPSRALPLATTDAPSRALPLATTDAPSRALPPAVTDAPARALSPARLNAPSRARPPAPTDDAPSPVRPPATTDARWWALSPARLNAPSPVRPPATTDARWRALSPARLNAPSRARPRATADAPSRVPPPATPAHAPGPLRPLAPSARRTPAAAPTCGLAGALLPRCGASGRPPARPSRRAAAAVACCGPWASRASRGSSAAKEIRARRITKSPVASAMRWICRVRPSRSVTSSQVEPAARPRRRTPDGVCRSSFTSAGQRLAPGARRGRSPTGGASRPSRHLSSCRSVTTPRTLQTYTFGTLARVQQRLRERAVVGHQQRARGVEVQPPDGEDPGPRSFTSRRRWGAPPGRSASSSPRGACARRRTPAPRTPGACRRARPCRGGVDARAELGHHPPVHADAPGGDELLGVTT
jgi:hypothetical protein